jgi:hypothetical protein
MERAAGGAIAGITLFWIIWFVLKIVALPILVVNIIYLVGAIQHGTVGTFDFGWLIISAVGVIVL